MGALRRRVDIVSRPGETRAALEDDLHHFRVTIRHQDGVVTEAFSSAPRHPNALCPSAGQQLTLLAGMKIDPSSVAVMLHTDPRQQCTHVIDLAGLAVAAAAQQTGRRTYEAEIPDPVDNRTHARLWRDGELILDWDMEGQFIHGPEPYGPRTIATGFTNWAVESLPPDLAEAALVLRRAVFISGGRRMELDKPRTSNWPIGGCWAWQPERAAQAVRVVGSTLDFTDRREVLTSDDQAWLAFEDA
jgi:hypothetical protein